MHSEAAPSKRLNAPATSSIGEAVLSSLTCSKCAGQAAGPFVLSNGTTVKEGFLSAGALHDAWCQGVSKSKQQIKAHISSR